MHNKDYEIRSLTEEEVPVAHKLESDAFPTDEAAGLDMLMYRHQEAPELMLGCFENESLIAYTCATRYHAASMKKEAMNMHIPNGESVCIHSICVEESMRRQGIALKLLSHLIESIRKNQYGAVRILLITKSRLIPLYTRLGFVLRCRSSIAHGHDPWYEFELKLK